MGASFQERYQLGEALGSGASATVTRALDRNTGRTVAVKVLSPSEDSTIPQLYERFLQEASLLARVRSPFVVDILDFGEVDGSPFLVMEYLEGIDLGELVVARGPLDPRRARELASQLVEGLAAIHEAGVVHRDLKPGNVLLDAEDRPKISDLGLAHAEIDSGVRTETGIILGSPGFMSPEVLRAKPAGPASDVYALGVILYYVLTARLPFPGESAGDLFRSSLKGIPAASLERLPEVWARILGPMMALRPGERPALSDLADALERLDEASLRELPRRSSTGKPMDAGGPPTLLEGSPPPPPSRRAWIPAAAGATALSLSLALLPGAPSPPPSPVPPPASSGTSLEDRVRRLGDYSFRRELSTLLGKEEPTARILLLLRRSEETARRSARDALARQVRRSEWYPELRQLWTRLPEEWWTADEGIAGMPREPQALRRRLARRLGDLERLNILDRILGGEGKVVPEATALLRSVMPLTSDAEDPGRADLHAGGRVLQEGCRFLSTDPDASRSVGRFVFQIADPPACRDARDPEFTPEVLYDLGDLGPDPGESLYVLFGYFTPERANFLEVAVLDETRNPIVELPLAFPELADRFKRFEGALGVQPGNPLLTQLSLPAALLHPDARSLRFRIHNLAALIDPDHVANMFLGGVRAAREPFLSVRTQAETPEGS